MNGGIGVLSYAEMKASAGMLHYADIFTASRPQHRDDWFSVRHPQMPVRRRAKLFSAFDALDGYSGAIDAQGIYYEPRRELTEEEADRLSQKLERLYGLCPNSKQIRDRQVQLKLEIFVPRPGDPDRGLFQQMKGMLTRIDPVERNLQVGDCTLEFENIVRLEIIGSAQERQNMVQ